MSRLGSAYQTLYDDVCGRHPRLRICHFQWLAGRSLYADLRAKLPDLHGRVLDVGCGDKPYAEWMCGVTEHVGIDVAPGSSVDCVITPGQPWPLADASFDAVICTQVMEHAENLEMLASEIRRVLVPGGLLLLTVPFMYNEHGAPGDYRRYSVHGVRAFFAPFYDVIEVKSEGGIGSTLGMLFLNWLEHNANVSTAGRMTKGVLLPVWIATTTAVNVTGWLLDKMDRTNSFYSNVLIVARKTMAVNKANQVVA